MTKPQSIQAWPTRVVAYRWALVGAGLLAAACSGDPTAPLAPDDVTGTYALVSIGGRPVPVVTGAGTMHSSVITINANATWSVREETQSSTPGSTPTVITAGGTWVLDARASTLRLINTTVRGTDSFTYSVRDRGRVLTVSGASGEYRYVKP